MGVCYTLSVEGVRAEDLRGGFFEGWPERPSPQTHLRLLRGSDHVALAVDGRTREVVGFATAISDGVLSAYVPLLEVLPLYRGRGIGGGLMRRMLDRLDGLYMVDLTCDPGLRSFYARLGMREAAGMARPRPALRSLGPADYPLSGAVNAGAESAIRAASR